MEHDPNPDDGATAGPNRQPSFPFETDAKSPERLPEAVELPTRPVATAWRGGLPGGVRAAAAQAAAVNAAAANDAETVARSAGKGFDRFWADTCRYWASSPDLLLKK